MSTTLLFVEHLITGIQAAFWMTLLVFSVFGFNWVNLDSVKDFEAGIALIVLSIVYPLGVFIDNIADEVFKSRTQNIRKRFIQDENVSVGRLLAQTKDEKLADYLQYVRIRIRISRSTALNFFLLTVTSIIFTVTRLRNIPGLPFWELIVFELVLGAMITTVAMWSWHSITTTFAQQIARQYEIINDLAHGSSRK